MSPINGNKLVMGYISSNAAMAGVWAPNNPRGAADLSWTNLGPVDGITANLRNVFENAKVEVS